MGAARMTDDYVAHDKNSSWDAGFNKDRRAEVIAMNDGFVMPAGAFGGSFPMNNYTPQELGMKTDNTPFAQHGGIPQKAPHTYDSNQPIKFVSSPPATTPPKQDFSAEENLTAQQQPIDGNYIEPEVPAFRKFNDWASENVGTMAVVLLVTYGVYKLGAWSANKQS